MKLSTFGLNFLFVALVLNSQTFAYQDISMREVLDTIERFETKIGVVKYQCEMWQVVLERSLSGWKVVRGGPGQKVEFAPTETGLYRQNINVVFEPASGKFKVSEVALGKSAVKDDGSVDDIYSYRFINEKFSMGSDVYMYERSGEVHTQEPKFQVLDFPWGKGKKDPSTQNGTEGDIIAATNHHEILGGNEEAIKKFGPGWQMGLIGNMAYTSYEAPTRLCDFLRSKVDLGEEIQVRVVEDGIWEIFCPILKSFRFPYAVKFFYDYRHGHVTRVEWGGCEECLGKTVQSDNWLVDRFIESTYGSNWLVPDSVIYVTHADFVKISDSLTGYSARKVFFTNQSVEETPMPDEAYFVDFSPGAKITDYIRKRTYVVGDGVVNDSEAAKRFMDENGLVSDGSIPSSNVLRVILFASLLIVSLIVAFRWRNRNVKTLALFVALGSIFCMAPTSLGANSGDWQKPEVRQCGQLVTVAACTYFGVPCDPMVVASGLNAGDHGTSLLKIKDVLESYDLRISPIKCDDFEKLRSVASSEELVIVPLVSEDLDGHFVLIVNRNGKMLAVDVLSYVEPFEQAKEVWKTNGTSIGDAVLLVRQATASLNNSLKVPSEIDLGDIVVDNPDATTLDVSIRVKNESDVTRGYTVLSSCGCMSLKSAHGYVQRNAEGEVPVTISLPSWGVGAAVRQLMITDLSGRYSQVVAIKANGVRTKQIEHKIDVSKRSIVFGVDFSNLDAPVTPTTASLQINGEKSSLNQISIVCEDNWIQVEKSNRHDRNDVSALQIRVVATDALREKLENENRSVRSIVKLSTTDAHEPIEVSVLIVAKVKK